VNLNDLEIFGHRPRRREVNNHHRAPETAAEPVAGASQSRRVRSCRYRVAAQQATAFRVSQKSLSPPTPHDHLDHLKLQIDLASPKRDFGRYNAPSQAGIVSAINSFSSVS
jgi:hypothetical protein